MKTNILKSVSNRFPAAGEASGLQSVNTITRAA